MFQHRVAIVGMMGLGKVLLQGFQAHGFSSYEQGILGMRAEIEVFHQHFFGFSLGANLLNGGYGRCAVCVASGCLPGGYELFLCLQVSVQNGTTPNHDCN